MRPFETYPGGKGADGVYQTIINHIAPHDVFISGFLGNCAVMRHKLPAAVNIGIDADKSVIDAWNEKNNNGLVFTDSVFNPKNQLDLFHCSFFDYVEKYMKAWNFPECLLYLDPPYLKATRKNQNDLYDYELTDRDHERLLAIALSMKCKVIISCYDNELYADYLSKWTKINFIGKTRHGSVTETIYLNYVPDGKLHDYRYAGSDFTDRQRIKRKVHRHVEKLKRLSEVERNAILNAMADQWGNLLNSI